MNMHKETREGIGRSRLAVIVLVVAVVSATVVYGVAALLVNIFERKQEARHPFFQVVELTDETEDPAVWGQNFPLQYDAYRKTADQVPTRFGGSEAIPRTPTEADPRSVVARSKLEKDPRLITMWAGYSFAVDYREARGHVYMLEDQTYTRRQQVADQPGTCLHCHASIYVPYMKLGDGDLTAGFEKMNAMPFKEARPLVTRPVACIDCHDPDTMQLRITRPAFIEGIRAYKAAQGIENYDVNTMADRQEMRSYVCGQCHAEYYFQDPENRLVYPWAKGLKVEQMLDYFDEIEFHDWFHAETGAAMLKVQHPEFELWNQGIHSRAGVACADCHMPYLRVGAMKISDHHVRSPLLNINNACQTCHSVPEDELQARAERIQETSYHLLDRAMDALIDLIEDLKRAHEAGADNEQLAAAREFQRRAQFMLDFVVSENSTGFHAGQETARILGESIDYSRRGQVAIRDAVDPAKR